MSALEALRGMLANDISRFDAESTKHKRLHRYCQTALIGLVALSSIVAAAGLILPDSYGRTLQFTVVCLTATTAAVSSWSEMRRARELWQHEREVYYALLDIQRGIDFVATNRELTPKDLEESYQRIAAVLGSSSQKWARIQEKKEG